MGAELVLREYVGEWAKVIDLYEIDYVLKVLVSKYNNFENICPREPWFKAFHLCKYSDLKVVMIGQDPYPQRGVATGVLFGNKEEVKEGDLSPSLKIVKDAAIDLEVPHNSIIFDQTLESWAKQGILMINSALTVEVNKVGSHTMLWRPFISRLLVSLSVSTTGIIYVLFGEQAKTFQPYINKLHNIVLLEKHPAYYARMDKSMPSTVFREISRLTKEKYGESIKWFEEY